MNNRKIKYLGLIFLFLAFFIFSFFIFNYSRNETKIIFLNVGQGDAILISQGSHQILIDSGKSGKVLLEKLGKHIPFWDRTIETVIETHPDQDHIGGFSDIFDNYEIKSIISTKAKNDSETFKVLGDKILNEKSEEIEAISGTKIIFPNGSKLEILYPINFVSNDEETNDSSIVSIFDSGKNKFIFTGDIGEKVEGELIDSKEFSNVRVLKVSHHGSKYSTSEEFLKKIMPSEAVISVGKNSYGHPSEEVINRLKSVGTRILRTDEFGDIEYVCRNTQSECVLKK